tara:strand:+ start:362 stop:595 length:234 start_codon:yes stop_codon:yes gene_type:complete
MNDAEEEEINLVSATPIMAKRNLHENVPLSPWLTNNKLDKTNATPMMTGGIIIQKATAAKTMQMGGAIMIQRPGMAG